MNIRQIFASYEYQNSFGHDGMRYCIVLLARVEGGAEQPGDDIARLGWFAPDSLPELAFEADAHIIERYFAGGIPLLETDDRFGGK